MLHVYWRKTCCLLLGHFQYPACVRGPTVKHGKTSLQQGISLQQSQQSLVVRVLACSLCLVVSPRLFGATIVRNSFHTRISFNLPPAGWDSWIPLERVKGTFKGPCALAFVGLEPSSAKSSLVDLSISQCHPAPFRMNSIGPSWRQHAFGSSKHLAAATNR